MTCTDTADMFEAPEAENYYIVRRRVWLSAPRRWEMQHAICIKGTELNRFPLSKVFYDRDEAVKAAKALDDPEMIVVWDLFAKEAVWDGAKDD